MVRIALFTVLLAMTSIAMVSAQRATPQLDLNPKGQPRDMRAGAPHRYYVWHDHEGWHLRTTTARERHRFHGEVIADQGAIQNVRTFKRERGDWVRVDADGRKVFFDLSTDEGLDGFDFRTEAQSLRFRLFMDGKDRPELVFVGLTGAHPNNVPFALLNPDAKPVPAQPPAALNPVGKPEGMGPGSTHRYLVWRSPRGVWHVRTTTAREKHTFTGNIEIEGGRVLNLTPVSTERKADWVSIASPDRISFTLTTSGEIDGFDFTTDGRAIKFGISIDGVGRANQVYIGARATNPPSIPFTLPAK